MQNFFKISFLVLGLAAGTFSCKDKADDPKKNEENELITTVHLHLTKSGGGMVMANWKDLSPDDVAGRTIDTLFLEDSTLYTGEIEFKDDTKSPAEDITEEVEEEGEDHLVVYQQTPEVSPAWFTITRTDKDSKNLEVGLKYTLQTAGLKGKTGLRVMLKHQPGVKDGSATPGDADVDVVFPVVIR
jgi:hypothetical protein